MQNYYLRIYGVKESGPDRDNNTWDVIIKTLTKVFSKIAQKLTDVLDSVHRLGQKIHDGHPKAIIIQFAMSLYQDTAWRDAKDNIWKRMGCTSNRICLWRRELQERRHGHRWNKWGKSARKPASEEGLPSLKGCNSVFQTLPEWISDLFYNWQVTDVEIFKP